MVAGPPDLAALAAELKALRRAIAERGEPSCRLDSRGLVILRLCAGIDLADWEGLVRDNALRDWLALPLDESPLPYLESIQRTLRELSFLSDHDSLTKLKNRRAFDDILATELDRAYRSGASLSLALLDIDHFKAINDAHGHPRGDEVLKAVAACLDASRRGYDTAARVGGEEFALILPGIGQVRGETMVSRILATIREVPIEIEPGKDPIRVTLSAGLASIKGRSQVTSEVLYKLADEALYTAKNTGRDRVVKAPIIDLARPVDKTLVHADEKRFLFTGK